MTAKRQAGKLNDLRYDMLKCWGSQLSLPHGTKIKTKKGKETENKKPYMLRRNSK